MKTRKRFAVAVLAGAVSLCLAAGAFAAKGQRGQAGARGGAIPPVLLSRLNLTSDQEAKVRAANETLQADLAAARGQSDPQAKRQATRQAHEKYQTAVKSTLNDDQQKQLLAMMQEAQEFRGLGPVGMQLVGLNLTDDQKGKIKAIVAKYEPEIQKARAAQRDATDKKAARQQMQELNRQIGDEVKAVLTPEQLQKIAPVRQGRRKSKA